MKKPIKKIDDKSINPTCENCSRRQGSKCPIMLVVKMNGWCRGHKFKKE